MPTYDYKCAECGHLFEELQSMKADALKDCPKCGKPALKRLMTGGSGMIFKGSGFYLTDYGKSGSSVSKKSTDSSSDTSAKPTEKKDTPKPSSPPSSGTKKD